MPFNKGSTCVDLSWDGGGGIDDPSPTFKDSHDRWPSSFRSLIGEKFFHPKTGHVYHVHGVAFQSELDRWQVVYQRTTMGGVKSGPIFTHFYEDFTREGRFLQIKGS